MSGKRHHYLPQFLLRGFLSQQAKGKQRAFVFRKGIGFREANIKDIAVESRFYEYEDESADDVITATENDYARAVNAARSSGVIAQDVRVPLISFVEHLVLRTRHSRVILNNSMEYMVDTAERSLLSDVNLNGMIDTAMQDERILTELTNDIMSTMPNADRRIIEQLARDKMREFGPLMRSDMAAITRNVFPGLFSKAKDQISHRVVEKQVEILRDGIPGSKRLEEYLRLHWSISRYESGALILGDVGPIGVNQDGEVIPPLLGNDLHSVFLPIRSDLLLVGSINSEQLDLSSSEVNALSSAMSVNLFVASNNSIDITRSVRYFGMKSDQFYKEIIDDLPTYPLKNT